MFTLAILAIGAVILFALAAKSPSDFHIERSVAMAATPEQIFPLINDFHSWVNWSPYEKLDPKMEKTYSGSEAGPGAVYEWKGNGKAGAGRIEIIKVSEPLRVTMTLDMYKPIRGHNKVVFSITPSGEESVVTWAMDGTNPFIVKVVSQFVNMDKMIGKDFEEGLFNLKALVEPPPSDEDE